MQNKEIIKNLEFIKKAYENLAENGAGMGRMVRKGLDCPVHIKNYRELYQCHADTLGAAIAAVKNNSRRSRKRNQIKYVNWYSIIFARNAEGTLDRLEFTISFYSQKKGTARGKAVARLWIEAVNEKINEKGKMRLF